MSSWGSPKSSLPPPSSSADERAQDHAHRLRRHAADPAQLLSTRLRVQEHEQRAQVREIEEGETLRVGVVEDEHEALLLRLVRPEHLGEEERAEVGHRRANRDARPDAAQREVLDRVARGSPLDAELGGALLRGPVVGARHGEPGDVALHVRREHGDACGRELLRDDLEGSRLSGPGRAGDQAMAVEHAKRDAHRRPRDERALVDAHAELDGLARDGVARSDRLGEARSRPGHRRRCY